MKVFKSNHSSEIYAGKQGLSRQGKNGHIRDVDPDSHEKVLKTAAESEKLGVEMMLVTDTIEATHHAVSKGWILEEDIAQIVEEKKVDESMAESVI